VAVGVAGSPRLRDVGEVAFAVGGGSSVGDRVRVGGADRIQTPSNNCQDADWLVAEVYGGLPFIGGAPSGEGRSI